jgi:bacterioferritin (cytochrome b1)
MQINAIELARLNFYRASELHGGLVLGQLVCRVRDAELMLNLTRHSAEEVRHAQLWTETIIEVGGTPAPVRDTYQKRLATRVGVPSSVFQVLALTQVFERRVYSHFIRHARLKGTHRVVRACLERMIDEEKDHLSWVHEWLHAEGMRRRVDVNALMQDYADAEASVYNELVAEHQFVQAA